MLHRTHGIIWNVTHDIYTYHILSMCYVVSIDLICHESHDRSCVTWYVMCQVMSHMSHDVSADQMSHYLPCVTYVSCDVSRNLPHVTLNNCNMSHVIIHTTCHTMCHMPYVLCYVVSSDLICHESHDGSCVTWYVICQVMWHMSHDVSADQMSHYSPCVTCHAICHRSCHMSP